MSHRPLVLRHYLKSVFLVFCTLWLSACAQGNSPLGGERATTPADPYQAIVLQAGDKLIIDVPGRPNLSGLVPVSENGNIGHPYLGEMQVAGLTVRDAEGVVSARIAEKGQAVEQITLEVINLQPVYVIGEVQRSGEYPFAKNVSLAQIIDQAGGYTYRADTKRAFVTRRNSVSDQELILKTSAPLLPGDIVRVPQQYF